MEGEDKRRNREVQCNQGQTVQQAVNKSKVGDIITVIGVCNENVLILSSKTGLTIKGGSNGAGITGLVSNQAVIDIRSATGITIQGLTISGPGTADGPDTDFGGAGIALFDGASANIFDCVVENNRVDGISINASQAVLTGNTIRNNNLRDLEPVGGVQVVFNGSAKLFNNQIELNNRHGVILRAQSNAIFSGGTIQSTQGDGLAVRQMSLANLEGATIMIINNTTFGIVCDNESRIIGVGFTASGNPSGDVVCTFTQ